MPDLRSSNLKSPWMMVALKPAGRRVVVVGSGAVARRRAEQFIDRGARVELFDPNLQEDTVADMPPSCILYGRNVARNDIAGAWLVVVATDNPAVNAQVGQWAHELSIDCNRTDDADAGTLAIPALLEDEAGWKLAVLGGEAGPLFSAWVKGLVGHLTSREQVTTVYNAMASARAASAELKLTQKERAFLLRRAMARILELAHDEDVVPGQVDGAAIVQELAVKR